MNSTKAAGALWGLFIGDSLALGPHWIYDSAEIAAKFGRISEFQPPGTSYHPGKNAGDQTHLGDQALILLQSAKSGYDPARFMADWLAFWKNPQTLSYRDHATKEILAHIAAGKSPLAAGSDSGELAGPARALVLVPLLFAQQISRESTIQTVVAQTRLTHNSEIAERTAQFLAATVLDLLEGATLRQAIEKNIAKTPSLRTSFEAAEAQLPYDPISAIAALGQSCVLPGALSAVLYLALKFEQNPQAALVENALAGGDSAARGLVLGALLGAIHGVSGWPGNWIEYLAAGRFIKSAF